MWIGIGNINAKKAKQKPNKQQGRAFLYHPTSMHLGRVGWVFSGTEVQ
jgi:hypothetical protein